MKMVSLKIDNMCLSAAEGVTILEAARAAGIHIPTLCHIRGCNESAVCRVCVVEDAHGRLLTACDTVAAEGMEVFTDTEKVRASRKMSLSLMCENHRMDCDNCSKYESCEFHTLCSHNGINSDSYETFTISPEKDSTSPCILRDTSKCVLCRRCVAACAHQGLSLISALNRGPLTSIGTALPIGESGCIGCGQCVAVCPTAALLPADHSEKLWKLLLKKTVPVVALVSPAAAEMLGECFHDCPGEVETGKVPSVLRKIGFDLVYSADAIESEYDALLDAEAARRGGIISAACPGIISYLKHHAPDKMPLLSEAPAPLTMLTEDVRCTYPHADLVFVGSCTAAKAYAEKAGFAAVLSVPEIAAVINRACVSRASALNVWRRCAAGNYDVPSRQPRITEAILSHKKITGIRDFCDFINSNTDPCGIIKAYACPDGCINGGGQSCLKSKELSEKAYLKRK